MYDSTVKRCSSRPGSAWAPAKPARRSSPAARSTDGQVARTGRQVLAGADPEVVEHVVEDDVGLERAVVLEPRDVGERPAGTQHAPCLAQGPCAVRDELEDERRQREVERAVLERQVVGEGDRGAEPGRGPCGRAGGRRWRRPSRACPPTRPRRRSTPSGQRAMAPSASWPVPVPMSITRGRSGLGTSAADDVEQRRDGGRQDGRPPLRVSLGDPVVPLGLLGHRRIVPCAGPGEGAGDPRLSPPGRVPST